jgi:hypothetical protein
MKELKDSHLSISRAMSPYATLLTPAQPYPSIVGPRRPSFPISGRISWSNSFEVILVSEKQRESDTCGCGTFGSPSMQDSRHEILLSGTY